MNIYLALMLLFLFSCKDNQPKLINNTKAKKTQSINIPHQSTGFENIMELNKKEAIKAHGSPIKYEVDELKNMQGEFYGELENTVQKEERQKKIIIHELTWERDSLRFITVWYEKKADRFTPRAKLIWYRDAEF